MKPWPRLNPWIMVPFLGIGLAVVFNVWMISTAKRIRPSKVEDHPYQASAKIDDEKRRREAFVVANMHIHIDQTPSSVQVHLTIGSPIDHPLVGRMQWWRPDDPSLDFTVEWPNPMQSMTLPVVQSGRWRVRTELTTPSAESGYLCDTLVEIR